MVKSKKVIQTKAKKIILSVAIAIIFVMFVGFAIESFYSSPKYDDFCDEIKTAEFIDNTERCEEVGGKWVNYDDERPVPVKIDGEIVTGYCDRDFECREDYETSREVYNRNVFFVSLIIGIITIIIAVLLSLESVSAGFMAGGVLLIIYGTIRYWGALSDVLRTLMLGLALVVLVWIGYKKLG